MKINSKLWIYCVALTWIQQVLTIVVLDRDERGKPVWRESHFYRDRSQIPMPSKNDRNKLSKVRQDFFPIMQAKHNTKKWKIGRIFYTLPVGATFPVFYSSRIGRKKGKKSEIYLPWKWTLKQGQVGEATAGRDTMTTFT